MNTEPLAQQMLEKALISELVVRERTARDMAWWSDMMSTYSADSSVDISWFQGTGPGFVEASRQHYETGARSLHQLSPSLIQINGERALSDTGCAVIILGALHGAAVNVITYARMYNRFRKEEGKWLIAGLRTIYQHDLIVPVNPGQAIAVDEDKLQEFRASYRCLSYLQYATGLAHYSPRFDLPGVDKPETVEQLLKIEKEWLAG